MKIILYSQSLLLFFRNGGKILLPPRAEAYMPTPEASDQGLGIGFIFPPHRAVFAVRLILFHLIVHRYYPPYNQGRLPCRPLVHTFPHRPELSADVTGIHFRFIKLRAHIIPPFFYPSSGNTDLRNCPAQSSPAQQ